MLISELIKGGGIRSWAAAAADAASRGMRLTQKARNMGYTLEPDNYGDLRTDLESKGLNWMDYRGLLVRDLRRIGDYPKAADEIEAVIGDTAKIVSNVLDAKRAKAFSDLKWLQEQGLEAWPHGRLQVFMPRESVTNRKPHWYYTRYDDEGNPLEEAKPILTGMQANTPPGNNKPANCFWTSTMRKVHDSYTSEWIDWVCGNMPEWHGPVGYVYEISPSARILRLDSDHDAKQIYDLYHRLGAKVDPQNMHVNDEWAMRKDFPWDWIRRHWDGVNHREGMGDRYGFTYGWDCESTAWFNTDVLRFVGRVPIRDCGHAVDDDEY
jgi:hypothetical protein